MLEVVQSIVDGIAVGSIIALAAVGLTLTYGILRLANFAHGDILTMGAYSAFWANTVLKLNIGIAIALGIGIFLRPCYPATSFGDLARQRGECIKGAAGSVASS